MLASGLYFFPGEFCLTYIQFSQVRSYATGIIVLYKQLHLFQEEQILSSRTYTLLKLRHIYDQTSEMSL